MFNLKNYWQTRYVNGGNSGAGSYNDEAKLKASIINYWIDELSINSITEIGSGDGNNLLLYNIRKSYCGYDISEKANELASQRVSDSKYVFTSDLNQIDYNAEMCLCLDVLFHQVNDDDYNGIMELLFKKGNWKYLMIYTAETSPIPEKDLAAHMKFRELQNYVKDKFPNWELLHWVSGYSEDKFPSNKKMFVYKRND